MDNLSASKVKNKSCCWTEKGLYYVMIDNFSLLSTRACFNEDLLVSEGSESIVSTIFPSFSVTLDQFATVNVSQFRKKDDKSVDI